MDSVYVFANTGKELPETLDFVHRCDVEWGLKVVWIEALINQQKGKGVRYKIVSYETAARNGGPFDEMVHKFGIPNKDFPFCTRELKERPIEKWARDHYGKDFRIAIGMRIDERSRATARKQRIYPLVEWWPTWEIMVRSFWASQPFDLGLKDYEGNCDLCWKKSLRKRLTILRNNPSVAAQWAEWERVGEYVFDRDGFAVDQLVEMSKRPFAVAVDKFELSKIIPELEGIDPDIESKCSCN